MADRNEASTQVPGSGDANAALQYYPIENYRQYPAQLRELIRRADMENEHCRGGSGNDSETLRACNRRQRVAIELERHGWCWGQGTVKLLISANDHWLPCSEDPYYRNHHVSRELPFPEVE